MCSIFANGRIQEVAAQLVEDVVDTTAAGDSFSAVYLVARRFNCSSKDAAMMAHRTAAYVICHKGAIAPIEDMPITGLDIKSCN
jgi:2-dehydro-3-deoxygluconokinase